jgi:hypothetical protein
MATYLTSNIFSDIYVGGNCVVKGTMTVSGGGGVTQWTTSGTSIYYNTGNVGIGIAAPTSKLHISSGDTSLALFGPNTTWSSYLAVGAASSAITSTTAQVICTNGNLHLDAAATGAAGRGIYMNYYTSGNGQAGGNGSWIYSYGPWTHTGNFGIGVTPAYPLHVTGDINFTGSLRQNGAVYAPSSQWTGAGGSTIYYVPFVGIGSTLAPTANLMVTGNVYVSNAIQTTNIIAAGFTSNVTTTTFTCDTMSVPFVNATQVTAASSIGIGTTLPIQALDVYGSMNVATVSSSTGLMFRNRLYNGNFQIWQRGATFTGIGTNTYTADRWVTPNNAGAGASLTVTQSSSVPASAGFNYSMQIVTTATTGAPSLIEQRIEAVNVSDFVNGTYVTVSFWAIQNSPATFITLNVQPGYPSAINTFTTFNSAATPTIIGNVLSGSWTYYRATFQINTASVGTNGLAIQFWAAGITAATNIQITGVQVEKGQVATPYEFRPYPIELSLCQRYYYQFNSTSSTVLGVNSYTFFGTGMTFTTSTAFIFIQYPVQMRSAVQTLTYSTPVSNFTILAPTASTATSIGLGNDSTSSTGCRVDVGGTFTAGQGVILRANNLGSGTICFLAFSCEL